MNDNIKEIVQKLNSEEENFDIPVDDWKIDNTPSQQEVEKTIKNWAGDYNIRENKIAVLLNQVDDLYEENNET